MPMIHTHQSYCSTLQQFGNQKLRQKVANLKPVDESERKRTDRAIEQGSKLKLANWQNASDFVNLRVRKISTSKRLLVRIIHVSQTCSREVVVVRTTTKETKHLPLFL